MKKPFDADLNGYVDQIRKSIIDLRAAAKAEQIDMDGPLGAWIRAQEAVLLQLVNFAEYQADVLVEHVRLIDGSLKTAKEYSEAEGKRAEASRQEIRMQLARMKQVNEDLKQERLQAMDDVAVRIADGIRDKLKRTILVREKSWNLRQNLRYAGFGSAMLFVAYLGGVYYQGQDAVRDIIELCRKFPTVDQKSGVQYCTMGLVDGSAKPVSGVGTIQPSGR